jgi:hypothetical protein
MASNWKKVISVLSIAAVLGSQVGTASACNGRRKTAAPATSLITAAQVARATAAPAQVARVQPAPVAIAPVAPPAIAPKTAIQPVVNVTKNEPAANGPIDLELYDVRLVDNGDAEQGPSYRLTVKNLGRTNVTSEITIALLASMKKDSDENLSVVGSLDSLAAGTTKSVDVRLPKGAESMIYLTAVAAPSDVTDANEADNVAVYEREAVLAVR